jgi:hypothetical protein
VRRDPWCRTAARLVLRLLAAAWSPPRDWRLLREALESRPPGGRGRRRAAGGRGGRAAGAGRWRIRIQDPGLVMLTLNLHCLRLDGTSFATNEARFGAIADVIAAEGRRGDAQRPVSAGSRRWGVRAAVEARTGRSGRTRGLRPYRVGGTPDGPREEGRAARAGSAGRPGDAGAPRSGAAPRRARGDPSTPAPAACG